MPYSPTTWVEKVTTLGPTNMNHLEAGVAAAPYGPDAGPGQIPIWTGSAWSYSRNTQVPCARAYHNAAQSITTATFTILALNSERFDTDTIHDTVTNNSRLTCKTAGTYQITGTVQFAAAAGGTLRHVEIDLNGVTVLAEQEGPSLGAGVAPTLTIGTLYALAVNDYVELRVYQDSGGSINVASAGNYSPEFMMVQVSV